MEKVEREIDEMLGITAQRQGQVGAYENTGSARQAQVQSTAITEPWFYMHNEVKKSVLEHVANLSRIAYKGKKVLNYVLDDVQRIMMEIDMDKVAMSSYGLFISNSGKENKIFNKLDELAGVAMQQEKTKVSDMIKAFRANSISEVAAVIEKGEREFDEQQAQASRSQQEHESKLKEAEQQEAQINRDHEMALLERKIEGEIVKAKLTGLGFEASSNDVDDSALLAAEGDRALKEFENSSKLAIEREKISSSDRQSAEANRLKEKEIDTKMKIEELKAKTAIKNKVVGEK